MIRISLLLSISLFCFGLHASSGYEVSFSQSGSDVYELSFELDEFVISPVTYDGITYSKILFENGVTTNLMGYAELPYLHATVKLPAIKNVSLKIEEGEFEDFELNDPLLPSKGVIYRDQDPASIPYEINPRAMRDGWYPQEIARQSAPFIVKDIRGVSVYVYPFRYNAVKNVLRVYKSITIRLIENETPVTNPLLKEPVAVLKEMDPVYRSLFINYESGKDLTIGDYGDILVICTDRDEDAMVPYVEWKREKGFNVEVISVETGANVKEVIQGAYDENTNLLYVQLVGDWADVKSDLLDGYAPMDPQLGCVAGTDEHPDICIGRFSASSADEVSIQVEKIINYEKSPESGAEWYSAALGVASNEGPGDDSEDDYEHINVIYDDKLEPSTYVTHSTAYDPTGTAQMITNAINDGVGVINYCGHGSETTWVSTGYSNAYIAGLANENMLPIIFSVACVNGAFNYSDDCFAEAWLKKEGGGAVMTMMSTINQPWDPPMRGQDYFNDLLTGGYDYDAASGQSGINTDEGRTTIGAITFNGLVLMCTEADGPADWETAKTWHLFGDPSMQPRTIAPATLTASNNLVLVGTSFSTIISGPDGPLANALVCLSQDGEYASAITDASGSVTLEHDLLPGTAKLVVTAFNMETIYEEVTAIPPEGAYIIVGDCDVDDSNSNGNGQADYGETLLLDVVADNVGTEDASSVSGVLSTADPYITIINNNYDFGDITAGEQINGAGAFEIEVSPDAPDNHYAMLEIEFSNDSKALWLSTFSIMLHAASMEMVGYTIDDATGNGNGRIDPGETVGIAVELMNSGSSEAFDVVGGLFCYDPYITIVQGEQPYGDITAGSYGEQVFSISASVNTPTGYEVTFSMLVEGEMGSGSVWSFNEIVGHIPVLLIDMDGNGNSADGMMAAIEEIGLVVEYSEAFPEDLSLYTSVFLCLGIFPDNHILSSEEGQNLADYLNEGGNLYMEGGDTWYYDTPQTPVHPMFGVNAVADGGSDLGTVVGKTGTFTEGMSFNYSGDNSYIDRIEAGSSAVDIFGNQSPAFVTGVAYDADSYHTIAASHEFGGLNDDATPSTKADLMNAYLEFFGFNTSLTAVFSSNYAEICENETVNFYDMSAGGVISWEWEFEGGDPSTSTLQNPEILYSVSGTYDVSLIVSDGVENHAITIEDYITVNTCTAVDEKNIEEISLFPNPNSGIFTLEIRNVHSNTVNIKVLNTLSRVVYLEENINVNGEYVKNINLGNLDKGLYFLVIENCQGSTVNRIIIR